MNISNLLFESKEVRVYVGVLRSGGAAVNSNLITSSHLSQLYEPYSDNPETVGVMRLDSNVLRTVIPRFLWDRWQVVSTVRLGRLGGKIMSLFRTLKIE